MTTTGTRGVLDVPLRCHGNFVWDGPPRGSVVLAGIWVMLLGSPAAG